MKRKRSEERAERSLHDLNEIANKHKRSDAVQKLKREKKAKQREERAKRKKELEAQNLPLPEPKTIDSARTPDPTFVQLDDEEVLADENQDELAGLLAGDNPPSVLLTTCPKPSKATHEFAHELQFVFPHSSYKKRRETTLLRQVVEYANQEGHTAVVVINEDVKQINGMTVIHLPSGPTASFKVSSIVPGKKIRGHGRPLETRPELVLNNFRTRLGRRLGRVLQALFHMSPAYANRQVATFHNQRDFMFFRHHRYIFEKKQEQSREGDKQTKVQARLQELGPRFTLKLLSLQRGVLDFKHGEFEWVRTKIGAGYNRRTYAL